VDRPLHGRERAGRRLGSTAKDHVSRPNGTVAAPIACSRVMAALRRGPALTTALPG